MYALWWIVIGVSILVPIGVVLQIVFWNNYDSCLGIVGLLLWSFAFAIAFIIGLVATILPIQAKEEYRKFVNTSEMVQEVYDAGQTLENAGLTAKVIELNSWLSDARVSQELYGNWSMYCNLDLDSLEYIKLNGR